jgi:hypothetical protein
MGRLSARHEMTPMGFWFVRAHRSQHPQRSVALAVAAFTARSASAQARKRLGPTFTILKVSPILYAHAWVIGETSPASKE